jgi:hypothetical protein
VEATAEREVYAVGDSIPVRVTVYNRGPTAINYSPRPLVQPTGMPRYAIPSLELLPGASQQWVEKVLVDQRSQPWWLSQPRNGDLFTPRVIGIAEDATGTPVVVGLNVRWGSISGGITAPVEFRIADPLRGEVTKPVVAAPAVSVILAHAITYVPANRPVDRQIRVSLRSASSDARNVIVSLAVPPGLRADSNARTIALPAGGTRDVDFLVRGRLASGTHVLRASAMVAGARYDSGYVLVEYDHIRPQRLYRAAEMQLRAVDVVIPPRATVAYIQGVGDNVAGPLRDLGLPVTVIDPRDLSTTDLSKFTAVVIGPRAYESSDALVEQNARVLNYARGGGTVVVQYGQYEMMRPGMLPYAITLTRPADRVTVEEAPVRVLAPASPLLNYPNKIGERDFDGWVQERGLYMPREFDPNWTPLFALSDPGEPENRGAVLVAPVGRGLYVYTTFSLFRQLPAAVPGAARLIINLIAATQGTGVTQ